MVEYYTGCDASHLTEHALVVKLGHILRIREMEAPKKFNKL